MSPAPAVAVAVVFVWLGMVLAISFLEAPLKFRAPNVTLQIGLGIGRLVFRALNAVEVAFAIVILLTLIVNPPSLAATAALAVACVVLAVQIGRRAAPADPPFRSGDGRTRRAALTRPSTSTSVSR